MQITINKLELASQKADLTNLTNTVGIKAPNTDNARLTTAKDVTGAINELFTNANNGKTLISNVVGSPLLATDTFQQQKDKIQNLKNILGTGVAEINKNVFVTNLTFTPSCFTVYPSPLMGGTTDNFCFCIKDTENISPRYVEGVVNGSCVLRMKDPIIPNGFNADIFARVNTKWIAFE